MAYPDEGVVQTWLDALRGLNVRVKKMFGCYCVYCNLQPVGWISSGLFCVKNVQPCHNILASHLAVYNDAQCEIPVPNTDFGAPWLREVLLQTAYYVAFHKKKKH